MTKQEESIETIELKLESEELFKLCMDAHEKNVTLNTHINSILTERIAELEKKHE